MKDPNLEPNLALEVEPAGDPINVAVGHCSLLCSCAAVESTGYPITVAVGHCSLLCSSAAVQDRLDKELERNLALRVEPGETADSFVVSGRGMMHLGILIENMRREGFEFEIGPPKVCTRVDWGVRERAGWHVWCVCECGWLVWRGVVCMLGILCANGQVIACPLYERCACVG